MERGQGLLPRQSCSTRNRGLESGALNLLYLIYFVIVCLFLFLANNRYSDILQL